MQGNKCDLFRSRGWCVLISPAAAFCVDEESTAAFPRQIDNFQHPRSLYYRQFEPLVAPLLLGGFFTFGGKKKRLKARRSRGGTFHFDSRIVNHINLLSYRHGGAGRDLCGFFCMALLSCNVILYIHTFMLDVWGLYGAGQRHKGELLWDTHRILFCLVLLHICILK